MTKDSNWAFNVGNEIGDGAVLCGTSTVYGFIFADLSEYTKIVFTGTPVDGKTEFNLRVLYNREGASGSNGEKGVRITTANPTAELNIADLKLSYFHLVAIKAGWGNYGTITSIKLVKPDDPLAIPKENLKNAIANANGRAYGKTEATASALTKAIEDGNAALTAEGATQESLTNAITAIENAINGLKLKDGFVNFTRDMFHEWTGIDAESTIKGAGGCDFKLNTVLTNNGMLYGNSSVLWNQYAKIVNAKSFIVIGNNGSSFGARTDRLEVGNGGEDPNGGSLTTVNINIGENGVCVIDLSEKESFRINAIKGAGFVTEMLVEYKPIAVSVGEARYSTFSSDQNTKVSGAKAYAAKLNGTTIELSEITEIPAGNGVIIEADADTYEFPVVNEAAAIENNELKVSDGTVTGDGSTIYVLAKKNEKVGFYLLTSGETIPAGKAYLQVSANGREFIGFAEDVTAIKSVETVKADGAIYNLAGQQVKKAQKGLYIINGKKVVVK